MKLTTRSLLCIAFLAAIPSFALAVGNGSSTDPAGPIPWATIAAVITSIVGVIAGVKQWLPSGTHTVVNAVILYGGLVASAIGALPVSAGIGAGLIALAGVIVSRFRAKGGWEK